MSTAMVAIPLFLLLIGVVGALIALFIYLIARGKGFGAAAAICVLMIVGVIVLGLGYVGVSSPTMVNQPAVATPAPPRAVMVAQQGHGTAVMETFPPPEVDTISPSNADDEWYRKMDDTVATRDLYTSIPPLAAAMAAKIELACEQVGPGSTRIVEADKKVDKSVVQAVVDAVKGGIASYDPSRKRGDNETLVTLRTANRVNLSLESWPTPLRRIQFTAAVVGPKGNSNVSLMLDEKPWLDLPSGFKQRGFLVVTSGLPAGSRDDALQRLQGRIRDELVSTVYNRARMAYPSPPSYESIVGRLSSSAEMRRFETDRITVGIDRPTGRVWYAAALIDARPQTTDHVAQMTMAYHRAERTSWAQLTLALGGMLLVLGLVYAVLNAITRGYFRGQLLAGIAVTGLIVVAVIMLLRS